ncbi:MAG: hypothetical protein GXP01_09705 [Alphaproteobacteria bacterium]|nr:hypothetical protein [Alphaproteobacteria bacterium]
MHLLCLDMGGTRTRGALYNKAGAVVARSEGPGGALSLGVPAAEAAVRTVWANITTGMKRQAPTPGETGVHAGIAGLGLAGRGNELCARLSDFASAGLVSDGYGALVAEGGGKPAALISVGTGVTGLRLMADGRTRALGGWGFPAGDTGGGAWLGLKAAGGVLALLDGLGTQKLLSRAVADLIMEIVGTEPQQIMAWQLGARPADFGALAPVVVMGANKGDRFCQRLIEGAAREIIVLAKGLVAERFGGNRAEPVHLAGGLGATLLPACKRGATDLIWRLATGDPVAGIALIATGRAPPENRLPRPGLRPAGA